MKYTHTHIRQQRTPENTEIWIALVSHGISITTAKHFIAQWAARDYNCLASENVHPRTQVATSRMNYLHLFWE
jgi:hypothetical protein